MAVIGYARVSSVRQSLDVQISKLTDYGCINIYQEKRSGTTANRPELKKCLDYVKEGDTPWSSPNWIGWPVGRSHQLFRNQ